MEIKKKKTITRRALMSSTARNMFAASIFDSILGSVLTSHMNKAFAVPANSFSRYIQINLNGAPPRWAYDLFLNPSNGTGNIVPNKMVSNAYQGPAANFDGVKFKQVKYGTTTTYVPHLWGNTIPRPNGSNVRAWELLQNIVSIRGVNVLSNAHVTAVPMHHSPVSGHPTLTSIVADSAQQSPANPAINAFRAMYLNSYANAPFKSAMGYSPVRYGFHSYKLAIADLFSGMKSVSAANGFSPAFIQNQGQMSGKMDDAFDALNPGFAHYFKGVMGDAETAHTLLNSAGSIFDDLETSFGIIYEKYLNLIADVLYDGNAMRVYPDINDRVIGATAGPGSPQRPMYQMGSGIYAQHMVGGHVDLRAILYGPGPNFTRHSEETLTSMFGSLAAHFTVLEFLSKNRICPSIAFTPAAFARIWSPNTSSRGNMGFDQHYTGCMPGIFLNHMYFLAFTSCLYEFTQALGPSFDDTLIYLAGEFNRAPRIDGSGSDHGGTATSVSLLSGRVPNFKVVGNIQKDNPGSPTNAGTWGVGAPINGINLDIVQVWGSMMRLMGITDFSRTPVNTSKLIFNTAGSFALNPDFNQARNI